MSSRGTVRLKAICAMLEECAKGSVMREKKHNWWVSYKGRSYRRLPLGPHGKRTNPAIEIGFVRSLVRHLEIDDECAMRLIPQLAN